MFVSVVIVSYNGREYFPDLFNSLKLQTLRPSQIIVVDNGSTDGSQEFLSKFKVQGLEFRVIFSNKNTGFAEGNNQGTEEALKASPDYIFLLNQDTIVDKNCLKELVGFAEKNKSENFFALQPLILCWPEKDRIQTSGDRIHFLGFGYSGDYKLQVTSYKLQIKEIPYASGAAMFIDARALNEVGLFDKDLFLYHDDLDLCLRARFLGYKIFLAPRAIVYHKYKAGLSPHRWYWSERNRLITLIKFYKLPTLILIFLPWLIMELGVLVYSLLTGWFWLKIKSYFSNFWQLPKTLWKRRKIQGSRKITDRELIEYLEAKFDFAGLEDPLLKYLVNPILGLTWQILKRLIFW